MIDGKTRVCGVYGNPVEHTKSPAIHNTLAAIRDINLVYVPLPVERDRVEDAVKGSFAMGMLGVNVTVPFKTEVMPFLAEIDPLARRIGAVNTLVRTAGGFKGYNTDMPGLYRAMSSDGVKVEGESVIILGAGGVARAVAVLLAEKKVREIIILNRTLEKAAAIAKEVNEMAGKELVTAMSMEETNRLPDRKFLVIQATSVGMHPNDGVAPVMEDTFYKKVHTGYDLVYQPAETVFMKKVKEQGGRAFNGLKMLVYQGVIAFELWNDISVTEAEAEQIHQVLLQLEQAKGERTDR